MSKFPFKSLGELKRPAPPSAYDKPTPKVSRQQPAKVLTAAEKAAFLASRPDLKPK